jgi:hypothetical protein
VAGTAVNFGRTRTRAHRTRIRIRKGRKPASSAETVLQTPDPACRMPMPGQFGVNGRVAPRRRPRLGAQASLQPSANTPHQTTKTQENRALEFKSEPYPIVFKGSCKNTTLAPFVIFLQKLLAFMCGHSYYSHCL